MTRSLTAEAGTHAWEDLTERLERFIEAWEAGEPPPLAPYLPERPPAHRVFVLKELVKVDLEQRWTGGTPRSLDSYTKEFPELLENGEPPCDLIYEEYHVRRGAGMTVQAREYYDRYPKAAGALKRMMGTEDFSATTQVFVAKRVEGFACGHRVDEFDLMIELGKGAFGSVFLARQVSMNRLVALKISADKGNEQKTLGALDHPNIVRVYDQRHLPAQRIRLLFMQFAPGGTLAHVVHEVRNTPPAERTGAILGKVVNQAVEKTGVPVAEETTLKRRLASASWAETVCRLGVQLAHGLDYAHKAGVLHRDVKPANILLAADGSPKLADFNISFCSQLDGASPAAYFGGSLAYMSPEQLEACNPAHDRQPDDLDGRSDLFALGVVLWELLHGERPFDDQEAPGGWSGMLAGMVELRRSRPPQAPSAAHRDALNLRLEQVIKKALSPEPDHRHPDCSALARDLMLCLNARAWDLVHDLKSGWRDWARRWPIVALFPLNLPPFILASAYNLDFNYRGYIKHLPSKMENKELAREIISAFEFMVYPVNGILIPLGIFLVVRYAWPMATALQRLAKGEPCDPEMLRISRHRSLKLGHHIAITGGLLWAIAGLAFPLSIHAMTGYFPFEGYILFAFSMGMCGGISCYIPFLATTWLSVRIFFPALLASSSPDASEQRLLLVLSRVSGQYLFVAAVVPMLGTALILLSDVQDKSFTLILIVAGFFGFFAAYATYQRLRADMIALSVATRPAEMLGTTTDTVETF